ncbi:MAG: deoxyhypusine synthase [Thermodesulfobacteriota bacterium]|nr:deoxyhypusine synthase [Thermodesulfobacteriota bacterium]
MKKGSLLSGEIIKPEAIKGSDNVVSLVENAFLAYNAGRLREACRLFVDKVLADGVMIGIGISGALSPAGLGLSTIIPLMKMGFVDWIVSTGANLYHDIHFGMNLELYRGTPFVYDTQLKKNKIIRIYDIFFDYEVLLSTDRFVREVIQQPEFQKEMGTPEFHYNLGHYLFEREQKLGLKDTSILSVAYQLAIPVYTPSPGDSSIGMNIASLALMGNRLSINPSQDVNEAAAIVFNCKKNNEKSGVLILGGGASKNFMLQTVPHVQEIMGIPMEGHDYFIQITDARPDTGGLSGATPSEAVSWGKINPATLPDSVVVYSDITIAIPIFTAYALGKHKERKHKRLYHTRRELLKLLHDEYEKAKER